MEPRKILVAVDASENALRAVNYTGDMMRGSDAIHIELVTIERLPERDLFATEDAWKTECKIRQEAYHKFLAKAQEILVGKGISEGKIFTRYIESCKSPLIGPSSVCSFGTDIAQDIMGIIEKEGFGTVVIGRRGVSKKEEFLFGSVSTKIVHYAKGCAIWVVN